MSKVELTLHSIYFHEDASIFSVKKNSDHLFTAGGDGRIGMWHTCQSKNEIPVKKFTYNFHEQSTTDISFCKYIEVHKKGVNSLSLNGNILLSGSDDHTLYVHTITGCTIESRQLYRGDRVHTVCCTDKYIFAGTTTGKLLVYNRETLKFIKKLKAHADSIDGLAYNENFNLLNTAGRDGISKVYRVGEKIILIEKYDNLLTQIDQPILFRHNMFSSCGYYLYVCTSYDRDHYVYMYHYPFHKHNIYAKIKFKEPVIKIMRGGKNTFFLLKNGIYIYEEKIFIDNATLKGMFDGIYSENDNILYVCSANGFISSVKLFSYFFTFFFAKTNKSHVFPNYLHYPYSILHSRNTYIPLYKSFWWRILSERSKKF